MRVSECSACVCVCVSDIESRRDKYIAYIVPGSH